MVLSFHWGLTHISSVSQLAAVQLKLPTALALFCVWQRSSLPWQGPGGEHLQGRDAPAQDCKTQMETQPQSALSSLSRTCHTLCPACCVPALCDSQGAGDICAQLPREVAGNAHTQVLAGMCPGPCGVSGAMPPALPLPTLLPPPRQPQQGSCCQCRACSQTHISPCASVCL